MQEDAYNKLNIIYNFKEIDFDEYPNGISNDIQNISDKEEVIKWINNHFNNYNSDTYMTMIERAIKANELEIVDILNEGFYFYSDDDVDTIDHIQQLRIAAAYANLNTFKLVLHNLYHDVEYIGVKYMSKQEFDECVKSNPYSETRNWITSNINDIYNILSFKIGDNFLQNE